MNDERTRRRWAALLIAASTLLVAGCAAGPGGPARPSATPYKGDQPWNISSRDERAPRWNPAPT